MNVIVNDAAVEVAENATVAELVVLLNLPDTGVAVAVRDPEWAVVPRSQWPQRTLAAGAEIEIVTAVQGG